jgi:hypothetical protein
MPRSTIGDDPAEAPVPHPVPDFGQDGLVVGVARPAPAAHRDALLRHRQADDDLRQVRAVVLGVPIPAEPALALVGIAFEVGARGIEEEQVDLEVEQVRHGEEHCFLDLGLGVGLHQQVHRPIGLVLIHAGHAGDRHVVRRPLGGG